MKLRIGQGFDLHRFQLDSSSGNEIILGGIKIKSSKKIIAHSDGDLLTHAIIDALLGATSLGDIGELFPDTSPSYKNINSLLLLEKVVQLLEKQSWKIINLDNTIICEEPKLSKFKREISQNLAKILKISSQQISLKAKTSEKIGCLGREEGIACFSVVLISS